LTATEQTVVGTCRVVRSVHTGIVDLVASTHGTGNPVVAVNRSTWLASAGGHIASFLTVAEHSIVAVRISDALGRHSALSICRITLLPNWALDWCKDATGYRIAAISRAQITIFTDQRLTWLTIVHRIAGFEAVADVSVVTKGAVRSVHTGIVDLVASIHGAGNPVVAVNRSTWLASAGGHIASFLTVAEHSIVAVRISDALGRHTVGIVSVV